MQGSQIQRSMQTAALWLMMGSVCTVWAKAGDAAFRFEVRGELPAAGAFAPSRPAHISKWSHAS